MQTVKLFKSVSEFVKWFAVCGCKICSNWWTSMQQNRQDGDFHKGCFKTYWNYWKTPKWLIPIVTELAPKRARVLTLHQGAVLGRPICQAACLRDKDKVLNACPQSIPPAVVCEGFTSDSRVTEVSLGSSPRGGELRSSAIGPLLCEEGLHLSALGWTDGQTDDASCLSNSCFQVRTLLYRD